MLYTLSDLLSFLDVPIFVSKPHFLDADEYYNNDINGPSSDRNKHDSFLNVEPVRTHMSIH